MWRGGGGGARLVLVPLGSAFRSYADQWSGLSRKGDEGGGVRSRRGEEGADPCLSAESQFNELGVCDYTVLTQGECGNGSITCPELLSYIENNSGHVFRVPPEDAQRGYGRNDLRLEA